MNVDYSNGIVNKIKSLRESVYSTEEFKEEFASSLKANIGATDVSFVPEQFGGWSVNVSTENSNSVSSSYIGSVSDALSNSIHTINSNMIKGTDAFNLANVIVTGPTSFTIKL